MDVVQLKQYVNEKLARDRKKWRERNSYFYEDVLRFFQYVVPTNARVLELGIDDGWLTHSLKPQHGVYLGMSQTLISEGRRKYPELTFVEEGNSWDTVPIHEKFDYIILPNVVGWVDDLQPFFTRLQNFAHARSRIVVTYYNYLWEPVLRLGAKLRLKQKQAVQNWLSTEDITLLLELAGFEVVRSGRRLLVPFYIPFVSWFFNQVLAKLPGLNRINFWHYVIARPQPKGELQDLSVSVVVPARNEKGNIEELVQRVPKMGTNTEIIFVEGNSTDGTWEEILRVSSKYSDSRKIRYFKQKGQGKADAVRRGFAEAKDDILMILDADLTAPPEDLTRFYEVLARNKGEYTHGNRLIYSMEKKAMRFLNLLANKIFSLVFSWLLRHRIKDTLCGTKALFRTDYQKLIKNREYFGDFDPFGDFDLIFGAHKLNLKMVEVPIHYKERKYGTTNIRRFRHGWLLLRMCLFAARKLE